MKTGLVRMLVRLYPGAWRRRYGEEFAAMLEMRAGDVRGVLDSVWAAVWEHLVPTEGGSMEEHGSSFGEMLRRPSGFLPLAMSGTALTMLLVYLAWSFLRTGGIVREADEGAIAHLWQLLMTVQMPIVLFLMVRWLGRAPRQTLGVLGLQAVAWLASCAPVYFLGL
jgi:hypothetical protein